MHPYPHLYLATATGQSTGKTQINSPGLPELESGPPPEFDGPGGVWSPEHLLVAAMADCFVLTFRGVARANRLEWHHLACRVEGVLERLDRQTRFTRFTVFAKLSVGSESDLARAQRLLHAAEEGCLVSNSLTGQRTLESEVIVSPTAAAAPRDPAKTPA